MAKRANTTAAGRLMERLEAFARHSDEPGRITRLFLSTAHRAAIDELMGWMRQAGLSPKLDAIGNVTARFEGREPGLPAFILASHIDSVRDAGKFDGNLGVLIALAVVEELTRLGERLPFAIELMAFGDEEGVRFPVTLSGSRAITGLFDRRDLDVCDADGISFREALVQLGVNPGDIPALARDPKDILGYLETHIEQGPLLEAANQPVGIVTGITSFSRFNVRVTGEAGHAGTVPMPLRKDALTGAAAMILAAERLARAQPGLVATVGQIEAQPGVGNVIPGAVEFALDIRHAEDGERARGVASIRAAIEAIAAERGLDLAVSAEKIQQARLCHPLIRDSLAEAIRAQGLEPASLPSGAVHDASSFDGFCPTGMLFVRCKGGVSHNPAEDISEADAAVALQVLLAFIRGFATRYPA